MLCSHYLSNLNLNYHIVALLVSVIKNLIGNLKGEEFVLALGMKGYSIKQRRHGGVHRSGTSWLELLTADKEAESSG